MTVAGLLVRSSWTTFHAVRSSLAGVPHSPGLVRSSSAEGGTDEIIVRDLCEWLGAVRGDLQEVARETGDRPEVQWLCPSARELEAYIVERTGGLKGLKPGRPKVIRSMESLATAPSAWGVYRIHRASDDAWYVGISSNVRARLRAHMRNGMYDLSEGDSIDVILAREPGTAVITTWAALQAAEAMHIRRLRERGKRVVNITGGGNGHPPRVRFNAALQEHLDPLVRRSSRRFWEGATVESWRKVDAATEAPIPGSEFPVVNLRIEWMDEADNWSLYLGRDAYIKALASGEGPLQQVRTPRNVSLEWLRAEYGRQNRGRNLDEDLTSLSGDWFLPADGQLRYFMHKRPLRGDAGREHSDPRALFRVAMEDIRAGTLPTSVKSNGFEVDPAFVQRNNLNCTMRVRRGGETDVYLKTEENEAAVRAEQLVSLLWQKLNWRGVGRVGVTEGGALVIPALGGAGIEDQGSFSSHFAQLPPESSDTLRSARAWTVKRVALMDLSLSDPQDVARFIIVNAVTGNTDRHAGNLHYGKDPRRPTGRDGHLLPLDHGRCLFNNDNGHAHSRITGTPIEAVTGQIGNPHQLLRPFTDLMASERAATLQVAANTLLEIGSAVDALAHDPAWADFAPELGSMRDRAAGMLEQLDSFFDQCWEAVVR